MIDLLVISQSCFRSINRAVFRKLADTGLSVEIVVPAQQFMGGKWRPADEQQPSDPPMHFLTKQFNNPRINSYLGLKKLLDARKPRFIFTDTDPVSRLSVWVGWWCKRNNAKLISLSCENIPFDFGTSIRLNGIKGIALSAYKYAFALTGRSTMHHVFTINDDGTKIFKDLGYKSISKTPLGYDTEVFFPNPAARTEIREQLHLDTTTFAYIGRLVYEKGVHILLQSLAQMLDIEWRLMLDKFESYTNPYNQRIYDMIQQLGLAERIVYIDADHFEIAKYMNAADAVILPSVSVPKWREQYGRVSQEAMACGTLVIAAQSGALPELVGDAGLIFPEGDVESLTQLLRNVVQNRSQYNHLLQKAPIRAKEYLSIERQAAELRKIIAG